MGGEPYGQKWKKYIVWPRLTKADGGPVDYIKLNMGSGAGSQGVQGTIGVQGIGGGAGSSGNIPDGGIIMWSGAIADIPTGWALCDGLNGTPNLVSSFIIGAGGNYAPGDLGGSADAVVVSHNHNGITSTAGSHQHRYVDAYYAEIRSGAPQQNVAGSDEGADTDNEFFYRTASDGYSHFEPAENDNPLTYSGGEHNHNIDTDGVSGVDANLPPYYALAYIMKLATI